MLAAIIEKLNDRKTNPKTVVINIWKVLEGRGCCPVVFCVVMTSVEWMNNAVHGITFPRANCTMVSPNCCISPLVQFIKKKIIFIQLGIIKPCKSL